MNKRAEATTTKASNLVFGIRHARVVVGTWWREGCAGDLATQTP
jgi:hypothetical protein